MIRRVAAGTVSTSAPFADEQPLSSADMALWLTSDLNHLGDESDCRPLASVPGFSDVSRPTPTGAPVPSSPANFDWIGRFVDTPSPSVVCFGSFVVHRRAGDQSTWPSIVLRARVESPASPGDKLDACLVVVPGLNGSPEGVTEAGLFTVTQVSGGAGWVDLVMTRTLETASTSEIVERPLLGAPGTGASSHGEMVTAAVVTVWASFAAASKSQVVALTLALEPT